MNIIKTAVIGVGHLGRHHARWYNTIKESELIGVFDIDQEKCRSVADDLSVTAFEKVEDVFGKVDAVSVVTPTTTHHDVAKMLLGQGIHCLVEKPITTTVEEAESLIKCANENNVVLTVGHIERFNPAVQALKKYNIEPRFIEAHRLAAFDPRGTDVAVVLDLMIHDIDLVLHLIKSRVQRIEAAAVAVVSDNDDIANARLTFENGAVANLTASRISLHAMRKLRIFQKSGYYSLDLAAKQADIYRLGESDDGGEGMQIPLGKSGHTLLYNKAGAKDEDMLSAELSSFIAAVANGTRPEVSAVEAAEALRVAIEVDRIGVNGVISGNVK